MDNFQSFLDATPEKGVIIVEYYWQARPLARSQTQKSGGGPGTKTSMAFFRPTRASDECWCGSGRRFSRCHRSKDDWTYVTLDPGQRTYSPVVLLERTFGLSNVAHSRKILEGEAGLLPVERTESLAEWCVPIDPAVVNDTGQLVLGIIGLAQNRVHLQTNSENRFSFLLERVTRLLGDSLGEGATIRAEPHQAVAKKRPPR